MTPPAPKDLSQSVVEMRFQDIEEFLKPKQPGIYEIRMLTGTPLKVGISRDLRKRLIHHRDSLQRHLKLRSDGTCEKPADVVSKRSILTKHLYFDYEIAPDYDLRNEDDRQRFLRECCKIFVQTTHTRAEARLLEIGRELNGGFRYTGRVVLRDSAPSR